MIRINNILSRITAGFVAVLVGFTSSIALIYQMVINLGGDSALVASWIMVLGIAMGLLSIGLSLAFKMPVLIAWSTPGAALLITSTAGFTINQAIGSFMVCALLIFLSGISGWFEKLLTKIPKPLANAMLAGILLNFGIEVFNLVNQNVIIVGVMLTGYLISKQLMPRFTMLIVLALGIGLAWQLQLVDVSQVTWQLAEFTYISPQFDVAAIISIALPLFIVTMASQNVPGIAVLHAHNYQLPISKTVSATGLINLLIAPFGGFSINLAAITAALCMSKDVDPCHSKRYWATVAGGFFYILLGLGAASLMSLFETLPQALILALAGIALFSTIAASLKQALATPKFNEAAIITFLITASDLVLWGIGSPLWGIVAGIITLTAQRYLSPKKNNNQAPTINQPVSQK
ncbi:MAG: benzoate/H(+) symporter BenE family transporter [Gammaproteobacteria bacterium]|nr:benzoate/H(+) symporter BenE family transporter [Gammaproteobacteria bacterium]